MLSPDEIADKLHEASEQFKEFMQREQYAAAKRWHYNCLITADFIELDSAALNRLFGEEGAFPPELVRKAYEKAGAK